MLVTYGMERVLGVYQPFVKRSEDGAICMMVAKDVDDFLISGVEWSIREFFKHLYRAFKLGSTSATSTSKSLKFLGYSIDIQEDRSVKLRMENYLNKVTPVQLSH